MVTHPHSLSSSSGKDAPWYRLSLTKGFDGAMEYSGKGSSNLSPNPRAPVHSSTQILLVESQS